MNEEKYVPILEEYEIKKFAEAMLKIIKKNASKRDSWIDLTIKDIEDLLKKEIVEYENASTIKDKIHETIDIANYSMFLWVKLRWQDADFLIADCKAQTCKKK